MTFARTLVPLVLGLVVCAMPVQAGGFIGASLGQSDFEFDQDFTGSLNFNDNDTAWKLWGGYDFFSLFGIEAGYADLGDVSDTVNNMTLTGDASAFYAAGVGQITIFKLVTFFGKVGLASLKEEYRVNQGIPTADNTETVAMYGIGIGFNVIKVQIRAEYELFDSDEAERVGMATVGVRWNF